MDLPPFLTKSFQRSFLSSWLCLCFNQADCVAVLVEFSISCWLPLIDSILLLAQCTSVDLTLRPLTVISIWRLLSEIPSVHQNCDAQQHVLSTAVCEPSTGLHCFSLLQFCSASVRRYWIALFWTQLDCSPLQCCSVLHSCSSLQCIKASLLQWGDTAV